MPNPADIALAAYAATPRYQGESSTDHENRVALMAQHLMLTIDSDKSPVSKAMDAITNGEIKHFAATIIGVRREVKTKRAVVEFYSEPNEGAKAYKNELGKEMELGHEIARTTPNFPGQLDGAAYRALVPECIALIGHKVFVTLNVEKFKKGNETLKSRVLLEVRDLGIDNNVEIEYRTNKRGEDVPSRAYPL